MAILCTEASDLGLSPGIWPHTIRHGDTTWTLVKLTWFNGDVLSATYHGDNGDLMSVFND